MKKKRNVLLFLLLLGTFLSRSIAQRPLDQYIKRGLDSNLALRQQSFDLQKARLDLDRARALFYPQVQVSAQYTLADGGRAIDVPLADLLNNVYSTLNQLTSSSKFPQVHNQSIQFLPNNFNDSKIEVSVPVYNPALGYNKKIKAEMINRQQEELNLYKRDLVFNIKQAYFQYQQSSCALAIYKNALEVVSENLRYNDKLVKHNVATREVALKAQAEVSKVQASMAEAAAGEKNARAYFNFLLNEPFETAILIDSSLAEPFSASIDVSGHLVENREELKELESLRKVLETNLQLDNTYKLPVVNGFYNIGFQGYGYHFNASQFYQLGGLSLEWDLFKGKDNKLKARQAQLDIDAVKNQYEDAAQQALLQVTTTFNQYQSAIAAMNASSDELASSNEAFRLTQSRYLQGEALQIELIDARTQMTNAQINNSLAKLAVLVKAAQLERMMATYPLQ